MKAIENFSINVGNIDKGEGYHVACCVGAARMHLQEDLREQREEMLREGRAMMESGSEEVEGESEDYEMMSEGDQEIADEY